MEPDGSNVLQGLPWFDHFHCMESFQELLMGEEQLPERPVPRTSPGRRRMIGYIARGLGWTEFAEPLIAEAESDLRAIRERFDSMVRGRRKE